LSVVTLSADWWSRRGLAGSTLAKLEAFDVILGVEIISGPRKDSVLLLAPSRMKQDIVNLELLEVAQRTATSVRTTLPAARSPERDL
jgi:hypothetical protein